MTEHISLIRQIILKNNNNKKNNNNNNNNNNKLFIFHCYYIMSKNKSSLAGISKQKYKLPPGLDNTSGCLGEVIDSK